MNRASLILLTWFLAFGCYGQSWIGRVTSTNTGSDKPTVGFQASFYISPSGSGSGDGSNPDPWTEANFVTEMASPDSGSYAFEVDNDYSTIDYFTIADNAPSVDDIYITFYNDPNDPWPTFGGAGSWDSLASPPRWTFVPINPNPFWTTGFETHTPINDPGSQPWRISGTVWEGVVVNDADSAKAGTKAYRSHVPTSGGPTYRSEIRVKDHASDDGADILDEAQTLFTTRTIGYSFMIPASMTFDNVDEHIFTQWKNSNFSGTPDAGEPGSPALDFRIDDDLLKVIWKHSEDNPHTGADSTNSQTILNPISKGVWYSIVIEIHYDYRRISNGGSGHLKIWVSAADTEIDPDNDLEVDFFGAIGYDDTTGHYWKIGWYPGSAPPNQELVAYFDETFQIDGPWIAGSEGQGGTGVTWDVEIDFDSWTGSHPNEAPTGELSGTTSGILDSDSYWAESDASGTETGAGHAKLFTSDGANVTMDFDYTFTSGTWAYEIDVSQVSAGSVRVNATGGTGGTQLIHLSSSTGPLSGQVVLTDQDGIQFKRQSGDTQYVINSFKMRKL